jgi:hypothetical protein
MDDGEDDSDADEVEDEGRMMDSSKKLAKPANKQRSHSRVLSEAACAQQTTKS